MHTMFPRRVAPYLTDRFPGNRIGPLIGDRERGAYLSWLAYYTGVFELAIMSKFLETEVPRATAGWVPVEEATAAIIQTIAAGTYILGERFSAADVRYATTFAMFAQSPMFEKSPVIDDYVKRVLARPAHARALAREA